MKNKKTKRGLSLKCLLIGIFVYALITTAMFSFEIVTAVAAETLSISAAEELLDFQERVNTGEADINATLTSDIDMTGIEFTPIGYFGGSTKYKYSGTFDGNGHKITNLTINDTNQCTGLFGYINTDGEVKNLTVEGSVTGGQYTGGIAGCLNAAKITNCTYYGTVNGSSRAGGFAGTNQSGTITNCTNYAAVTATASYVGGIAGINNKGSIDSCKNMGAVASNAEKGSIIGGITGNNYADSVITNCINEGNISGIYSNIGGISSMNTGTIIGCRNSGNVTWTGEDAFGCSFFGGIASDNAGTIKNCYNEGCIYGVSYVGGIAGRHGNSSKEALIEGCMNNGKIKADNKTYSSNIGGISGTNYDTGVTTAEIVIIRNCCNLGEIVSPGSSTGGISGSNIGGSEIHNCYNTGIINATGAGIIAGRNSSTQDENSVVNNCYYIQTDEINSALSAVATISSGSVITSTEVKDMSAFERGEVTYLLNESKNSESSPWVQTLTVDSLPVLSAMYDSLEVVGFTEEENGSMLYANCLTDGSIEIKDVTGKTFNIVVDTSVFGGEGNAKYLEAVKVLKNDEISKIVPNYYYTDENKQYALFSIELESDSETTVRAEIVASENCDEAAAENRLYYVTKSESVS
ncbi:MAG: hypothetical protein Q4D26_04395 [Clostridia bacterium]|nr:hypothetical protein [Clostridia bacterium]